MAFYEEDVRGVTVPHWVPDDGTAANFGDEIGPLLVRALAGEQTGSGRLLSVGSVMHFGQRGNVIWGAGINGKVRQTLQHPLDVRAVRGPLTRAVLLGHGIDTPEIYGDPALLFPRLFEVPIGARRELLVMPNLNELGRMDDEDLPEQSIVSPLGDAFEIVSQIRGADFVVASSLHALVFADAYGIPARPLVPKAEHAFKYLDYYAGTGRADVRFASSVAEACQLGPVAAPDVDLDALQEAFPQDLWGTRRRYDESSAGFAQMRSEAMALLGEIALAVGRDAGSDAALALLRAQQLIAEQPTHLVSALTRASDGSPPEQIVDAAVTYLRASDAHGAKDQRLARALARALTQPRSDDDGVIARVVATGKVSLARAIVSGTASVADGRHHLGDSSPATPEQTAEPAPEKQPEQAPRIKRGLFRRR